MSKSKVSVFGMESDCISAYALISSYICSETEVCVCRRQNRTDTEFQPHAAGEEPYCTIFDTPRGVRPVRAYLSHSSLDGKPL